jgi:ribosome-associated toxin RatA of RatAB toxin-antitoxin module
VFSVKRSALLPYSPAQMYALVAEVEAYPQFLPWCRRVQVHYRDAVRVRATLDLARGPLHQAFTTENRMEPDRSIEVRLASGPFRHLHGLWQFEPVGEQGCRVNFEMDFDFSSRVLAAALGPVFNEISRQLVDGFRSRAVQVYGRRGREHEGGGGVRPA